MKKHVRKLSVNKTEKSNEQKNSNGTLKGQERPANSFRIADPDPRPCRIL